MKMKKIIALIILFIVGISAFSQNFPDPNSLTLRELYEMEFMVKEQIKVLEEYGESRELINQLKRYSQLIANEIRLRMATLNKEM